MNLKRIISTFASPNREWLGWLMRALPASAETFLHHGFGERYTGALLSGALLVAVVSTLSSIVPREDPTNLMPLVMVALMVCLCAHFVSAWKRRRVGIHVESHSSGTAWPLWSALGIPAGLTKGLVEPLLCLAAGFCAVPVDPVFSVWLCCAGLGLMVKTVIEHHRARNQVLDVLDARVVAHDLRANLNQRMNAPAETQPSPVTVSAVGGAAQPTRPARDLFRNLDPALRRLMDQDAPAAPPNNSPEAVTSMRVRPQSAPALNQQSAPQRIHVRPGQLSTKASADQPSDPAAKPQVKLVRTRPAPLRVGPSVPAATTDAPAAQDDATIVPNPSDTPFASSDSEGAQTQSQPGTATPEELRKELLRLAESAGRVAKRRGREPRRSPAAGAESDEVRLGEASADRQEPDNGTKLESDTQCAVSVNEAAHMLGVSTKTVRRLIDRGLLRASRAIRHLLIPKNEIERFLKETTEV